MTCTLSIPFQDGKLSLIKIRTSTFNIEKLLSFTVRKCNGQIFTTLKWLGKNMSLKGIWLSPGTWEKSCLPRLGHSVAHLVIYQYCNVCLEIASAASSQLPPPVHRAPLLPDSAGDVLFLGSSDLEAALGL